MEKLQSALEKARLKRSGDSDGSIYSDRANRPSPTPRPKASQATDALWAGLNSFEPSEPDLIKNRIVTYNSGPDATVFDILRTKILLQMRQNGWSRLAITSPTPSCGKTTTACNLAMGMSRQSDLRSILFDLDLRRPGVSKYIGFKPQNGIRSLLEGSVPFADQAVRVRDNLAMCMARKPTPDPTRYLLSDTANQLFDDIQTAYEPDLMIFDLPPFLVSDDTRAFIKNVDAVLIMARAGETKISQIDACEREIAEHTNVLGVALNQCEFTEESSGYEYY